MSVQLACEDDQTPTNVAVITEVIVNTSAIIAQSGEATLIPLQQQVNVCLLVQVTLRTVTIYTDNSSNFWFAKNCAHT